MYLNIFFVHFIVLYAFRYNSSGVWGMGKRACGPLRAIGVRWRLNVIGLVLGFGLYF